MTDLDGGDPTTIQGEPGATGLALSDDGSTVHAAPPGQDAIAGIDTNTPTETARYPTGAGTRPDSLAVAGGTLWFGYGGAGAGGIGSVDGTGAVKTARDCGSWAGSPLLATTPTPSGTLVAAVQTGDTSAFVTYRVADGGLTRQAARALPVPDLTDFAVTADGQDVAVTSWRNPSANRFRVSDLAADGLDTLGREPPSYSADLIVCSTASAIPRSPRAFGCTGAAGLSGTSGSIQRVSFAAQALWSAEGVYVST